MKSNIFKLAVVVPMLFGSMNVMAEGAQQHFSNASTHSAQAVIQTSIAGAKVSSGVVAVPLLIVGEVGNVSGQVGTTLWENAHKPIGEPLYISDEIMTSRVSPDQAMKIEGDK